MPFNDLGGRIVRYLAPRSERGYSTPKLYKSGVVQTSVDTEILLMDYLWWIPVDTHLDGHCTQTSFTQANKGRLNLFWSHWLLVYRIDAL